MSRVVVTGATGFLGLAVRQGLKRVNMQAHGLDARPAPGVNVVNVCRPEQLDAELGSGPTPAAVVHLAAAGSGDRGLVAGADADTAHAVRTNVEGFVHVVQAAARRGVPRVVWSSSTTVYGPTSAYGDEPIDETAPLRPTTAYGATKTACEHLGPILAQRLGIDVVALRLPMVYGPGRWYGGSQAPLVELAEALRHGTPATVQAWEGDADWVHVEDAATAIIALLEAPAPRAAYHVVGHRGSFADLARALVACTGGTTEQIIVQAVPDGAPDLPATDDAALRADTGFVATFPDSLSGAANYLTGVPQDLDQHSVDASAPARSAQ